MNKPTQKQIDRAIATGDEQFIAATLAPIHRASGAKIQKEIDAIIERLEIWHRFTMVNGTLVASHTL